MEKVSCLESGIWLPVPRVKSYWVDGANPKRIVVGKTNQYVAIQMEYSTRVIDIQTGKQKLLLMPGYSFFINEDRQILQARTTSLEISDVESGEKTKNHSPDRYRRRVQPERRCHQGSRSDRHIQCGRDQPCGFSRQARKFKNSLWIIIRTNFSPIRSILLPITKTAHLIFAIVQMVLW